MLFAVIWLVDASWGRALNIAVRIMRNLSSDSSSKRPFLVATTVGIYQSHIPISCTAFPPTITVARVRSLVLETVLVIGRGKIARLVCDTAYSGFSTFLSRISLFVIEWRTGNLPFFLVACKWLCNPFSVCRCPCSNAWLAVLITAFALWHGTWLAVDPLLLSNLHSWPPKSFAGEQGQR